MVRLNSFPLQAEKIKGPAFLFIDQDFVLQEGRKIVSPQEVHIFLTRQVGTLKETFAELMLTGVAPKTPSPDVEEQAESVGKDVHAENCWNERCK
mgnify:CR=1 FL=1